MFCFAEVPVLPRQGRALHHFPVDRVVHCRGSVRVESRVAAGMVSTCWQMDPQSG